MSSSCSALRTAWSYSTTSTGATPCLTMLPSPVAFSRRADDQATDKREKPTRRSITQCPDKVYEGALSSSAASRGCDHPTGLVSSKTAHRLSKERRRNVVLKFPA